MECLLLFAKRLMYAVGRRTHLERRFAEWAKHFSIDALMSFGCCQSPVKIPSVWRQTCSSVMCCTRVIFDKGKFGSRTLRSWKILDASELHVRRFNATEVRMPTSSDNFKFFF